MSTYSVPGQKEQKQDDKPTGRFISPDECSDIFHRVQKFTRGGGRTFLNIEGSWTGNIRWGRNEIISCGDVRDNRISVWRNINGASAVARTSNMSDTSLAWATAKAERFLQRNPQKPDDDFERQLGESFQVPKIWYDSTFNLLAKDRADIADSLIKPAEQEGMFAAGYIQVSGHGLSITRHQEDPVFIRYTQAQLSVTVRDPKGMGSGWAGVDWNNWHQIDGKKLTAIAIDKCLRSRNPVAIEPGRYNVILEPQAVHDIAVTCFNRRVLSRIGAEHERQPSPYSGITPGSSKIGLRIFDERITVSHDPMDESCSFPPISGGGDVYNKVNWVENGVLKDLEYNRSYAIELLGLNRGLPSSNAYSMSGGTISIGEMTERMERGLLVTRFSGVTEIDFKSLLHSGYTRDGLWLVEKGKISKPVKNMRFTESPLHTFNNIIELGVPQRVFSPEAPAVVPPVMSKDFSFTATIEAI